MTSDLITDFGAPFEVDLLINGESLESSFDESLFHGVERDSIAIDCGDGLADTIDGDAGSTFQARKQCARKFHRVAQKIGGFLNLYDFAKFLNYSGEQSCLQTSEEKIEEIAAVGKEKK